MCTTTTDTAEKSRPCASCRITACKKNVNPLREIKTTIELNLEAEIYKKEGCPYKQS